MVVPVGLVELDHRELGVVARADPLVPEVAVDLEDLLQPAHGEALEVELRRDAQEHVHVERVVVRRERLGRRAPGNGMQHGRLDLEVAARHEELADRLHQPRALDEGVARLRVHDEVDVAVAVARLHVREPVELVRQRPQRLRQQPDRAHLDRELARLRAEERPLGADDVAQVPVLEVLVGLRAEGVGLHVDLDAPAHVLERGEGRLAHQALQHHPAGHAGARRRGLEVLLGGRAVGGLQVGREVLAREVVGEGVALLAQAGELGAPLRDDLVLVLGRLGRGILLVFGHGQTPCLRDAAMKSSRSPSSTACVLPTS